MKDFRRKIITYIAKDMELPPEALALIVNSPFIKELLIEKTNKLPNKFTGDFFAFSLLMGEKSMDEALKAYEDVFSKITWKRLREFANRYWNKIKETVKNNQEVADAIEKIRKDNEQSRGGVFEWEDASLIDGYLKQGWHKILELLKDRELTEESDRLLTMMGKMFPTDRYIQNRLIADRLSTK